MRAIVFANGPLENPAMVMKLIQPEDTVVAADGGAKHCLRLGITPQIIIGDFDSLTIEETQQLVNQGSQVVRYPSRKDYTDLELALQHIYNLGIKTAIVAGALGARWDQTLANLLLPLSPELNSMDILFVEGAHEISLIRPGVLHQIQGTAGDTVSLVPIRGDAKGVSSINLEYPLKLDSLIFGASRGISNVLTADEAFVSLQDGILICVVIHQSEELE